MFRKKLIFVMTIVTLLTLLPLSVFAASTSNGSGITLYYPDSGVCDPDFDIHTTGVPADGFVRYQFFYAVDGVPVYPFPWQQMAGNLSAKYPYDQVPEGITEFAIVLVAYDASGAMIGSQFQKKWDCTPPPPPPGGEGCTPGYWRNHFEDWPPTGYSTGDDFDATFGTGYFNPDITLGEAVWLGGGGVNVVARHGTAGLLSAAHPDVDYPYTVAEVIAFVQAGDVGDLVDANELGCDIP